MRPDAGIGATVILAALLVWSGGCRREADADQSGAGPSATPSSTATPTPVASVGVRPGIYPNVIYGNLRNPYAGAADAAVQGRQLFVQYNCYGCHGGRGGGGMGPSLRDGSWIYGNGDTQLFATIVEGRPAGMPAWGSTLPREQIWQLITYIRTLGTPQEPDKPPPEANVAVERGGGE